LFRIRRRLAAPSLALWQGGERGIAVWPFPGRVAGRPRIEIEIR
jgi:hypothetical protein